MSKTECLNLSRRKGFYMCNVTFDIFIDDINFTSISNNQSVDIPLEFGPHQLFIRSKFGDSETITFDFQKGAQCQFECGLIKHRGYNLIDFLMLIFTGLIFFILDIKPEPVCYASTALIILFSMIIGINPPEFLFFLKPPYLIQKPD